jgi:hypothetical protein
VTIGETMTSVTMRNKCQWSTLDHSQRPLEVEDGLDARRHDRFLALLSCIVTVHCAHSHRLLWLAAALSPFIIAS